MSVSIKKRIALGAGALATVGAVGTLVAGVTFGLFSANTTAATQSNSFATGTVAIGTPSLVHTCAVTNMVPGDQSVGYSGTNTGNTETDLTCEYQVQYTGSAPADIGLSATLNSSAAGSLGKALLWQISSATASTNAVPADPGTNVYTSSGGAINANSSASPMFVAADPGNATPANGNFYTFYVDFVLPSGVTSQTLSNQPATVTLEAYAVQSANNGVQGCTQGSQCAGVTNWS